MQEIQLRRPEADDAPILARLANNKRIARYLTNAFPSPYTLEDAERFIAMAGQASPTTIHAIEYRGSLAGLIGLHPQADIMCKNFEVGYWVAEEHWGKGIATEALHRAVEYGFKHFDVTRIFGRAFGSNIASQRVLEKAGFVLEARFEGTIFKWGAFEDELIYAVRRSQPGA